MIRDIADFWASRAVFNKMTTLYDINGLFFFIKNLMTYYNSI